MTQEQPKIGLALSGGGVRGLAHLGILEVLEKAEIPIHYLAGTSMGGIIAGLYAAGAPLARLIDFSLHTGIMDFASRDPHLRGLFGHAKMSQMLTDLIGRPDMTFEELRIPTTVVASDVESGEMVLLNQGPLIPALLATSAFPIIFAPVRYQGRWLIDGGVLNNFPVDVVYHMGADRVLGVNTPPTVRLSLPPSDPQPNRLSGRALFTSFTNATLDWKQPLLIAETGAHLTVDIVNHERLQRNPPHLLLQIELHNTGTFTTDTNAAVIQKGREIAKAHLDEIKALWSEPLPPRWQRQLRSLRRRLRRAWDAFQQPDYGLIPQPGPAPATQAASESQAEQTTGDEP
ncbi:MAG: patatin-like phospholipase family protein [Anaerolineales bacterium]